MVVRLGTPGFHVFDVNGEERWRQSHVPGARLVSPRVERRELPDDPTATVVFYCIDDG